MLNTGSNVTSEADRTEESTRVEHEHVDCDLIFVSSLMQFYYIYVFACSF